MKIVEGKKLIEISESAFLEKLRGFSAVELDFGTGDGRYVYKSAVKNPNIFYIGVDPAQKQLEIYSAKAVKEKIVNVAFILGSADEFPFFHQNFINSINILFPWGSLLGYIANPNGQLLKKFHEILVKDGTLNLTFGYSADTEPTETTRLNLDEIDENYIKQRLLPAFIAAHFELITMTSLKKDEIKQLESTWSKKLAFGKNRPVFYLSLKVLK